MAEDIDATSTPQAANPKKFDIVGVQEVILNENSLDNTEPPVNEDVQTKQEGHIMLEYRNPLFMLQKLKEKFNVNYNTYTRKDGPMLGIPDTEAGRFDGREVNVIGDELEVETAFHEYFHALMQATKKGNPELWKKFKQEIDSSKDGNRVRDYVLQEYPNHKRNFELSGQITENAYDEMVTTLMGACIDKRLRQDNWFGVLRSFIKDKGSKLDPYLKQDIQLKEIKDLEISDLADVALFGEGKIDIAEYMDEV